MPLVVEDGTGVTGAVSYADAGDAEAYFVPRGLDVPADALLLRAMDSLEALGYKGRRTDASQQLSWPRTGVADMDGGVYPPGAIPRRVVEAQMWLAHYIGTGSDPGAVGTVAVRRETVGPISTEYAVATTSTTNNGLDLSSLPNAYARLEPLLTSSSLPDSDKPGVRVVRTYRA